MSVKLNAVCELIVDCPHSTEPDEGRGYPIIRTPNIGQGYLDFDGVQRVGQEAYDRRNARAIPRPGDLILAREAPAGNVGIIPEGMDVCLGQRTVLIRPSRDKVNPFYLNYYLNAPKQRHRLLSNANGATVSHVNMPIIRNLPVDLPPLPAQQRIAGVLSTYDKLIENNRRQITLLEEAAQRLYKEWFVDLRFPGHEATPIHNGLPEGWKRSTVGNLCRTVGGGTPSTKVTSYYDGGNIPWVTPTDVTGNIGTYLPQTAKMITEDGLSNSSAKMIPKGSILMTSRASIGYFAICDRDVCTNQGFISCISNTDAVKWQLLQNLKTRVAEMKGLAKGSTFLEISKTAFRAMPIVMPPDALAERFSSLAQELFSKEVLARRQLEAAREARDRLLPKLMSGEIEV